jgi:hypothetical protein
MAGGRGGRDGELQAAAAITWVLMGVESHKVPQRALPELVRKQGVADNHRPAWETLMKEGVVAQRAEGDIAMATLGVAPGGPAAVGLVLAHLLLERVGRWLRWKEEVCTPVLRIMPVSVKAKVETGMQRLRHELLRSGLMEARPGTDLVRSAELETESLKRYLSFVGQPGMEVRRC